MLVFLVLYIRFWSSKNLKVENCLNFHINYEFNEFGDTFYKMQVVNQKVSIVRGYIYEGVLYFQCSFIFGKNFRKTFVFNLWPLKKYLELIDNRGHVRIVKEFSVNCHKLRKRALFTFEAMIRKWDEGSILIHLVCFGM